MDPVPLDGWEIELTGLIRPFRVIIRAEDLPEMDQVEYEMILQCSGNGRNEYEATNARGVLYHGTVADPGVRYPPYPPKPAP